MLKDTKVGLAGHQEALLYNVNQAETKEVKWDVHEVGCRQGH